MIRKMKYELLLVLTAAMWGLQFPLTKFVGASFDAIPILAVKYIVAVVALTFINIKKLRNITRKMVMPCGLLGLLLVLHSFLQVQGLKYTSASNSGFITSTNVIFVPIFMFILFREKPAKNVILGLILMLFGFLFTSEVVTIYPFKIGGQLLNLGDLLTLLSALFTGLYMIFNNRIAVKYDEDMANYIQFVFAAVASLILWPFVAEKNADFSSTVSVLVLIYCGVFATALGFLFLIKAQKPLGAVKTAVISASEPVFATVFALFIPDPDGNFGTLTLTSVLGGLLILAGVIVTTALNTKNK